MQLGIFAKTFPRPTLEATLDAVVDHGFRSIQFNLQSAGLESMPLAISESDVQRIRTATEFRGIEISALSATFNMIHPDPAVRADGLARLAVVASAARPLGASVLTLCTGTRDPGYMWRHHPENNSASAWDDLLETMAAALEIAGREDVMLGIEPEPGNVVNSARKCRDLLDAFASSRLTVVFDSANLVSTDLGRPPGDLLEEAFGLLGADISIGHGKDCGPAGEIVPAGQGIVPWDLVAARLSDLKPQAPLIIHGIDESHVAEVAAFLKREVDAASIE